MFFDVYIIFMTAFALIGVLFLVTGIIELILGNGYPESVTIMKYSQDEKTMGKIKYIYNNIPNNEIVLIGENRGDGEFLQVKPEDIQDFITNALFTNSDN